MKTYDDLDGTAANSPERITVGIAESAVTTDGAVIETSGLGSCVGVALRDPDTGVTGLVHVMLPSADGDAENPAKYADTGIERLIEEMVDAGADRDRIRAKIAGGSDMLEFSSLDRGVGVRNVEAVEATLERFDVPLLEADVGGDYGRSLAVDPRSGELRIDTADAEDRIL